MAEPVVQQLVVSDTPPTVERGKLWYQPSTGLKIGVDLGASPRKNQCRDPRFRALVPLIPTVNLPSPLPATRIGSFNIYGAGYQGEQVKWADRKAQVASYVKDSNCTLFGIQELNDLDVDQGGELVALLGASWRIAQGLSSSALSNGILYDSTAWSMRTPLETTLLPGTEDRTLVVARMRHLASGVEFMFGSVHLSTSPKSDVVKQAELVSKVSADLIAEKGCEVIIAGDWSYNNTDLDVAGSMVVGGMTPAKIKGTPTLTREDWGTYTAWLPAGRMTKSWLDHIYVSPAVQVDAVEVVARFANGTTLPLATPMPSDHLPIVATVQIKTARPVALQRSTESVVPSGNGAVSYQDSGWCADGDGGTSARVDPKSSTGTGTCFYPAATNGVFERLKLVPGKSYQVSAVSRLESAQTGTLDSKARRITIGLTSASATAGATNHSWKESVAAPNAAGVAVHAVSFTVPADATQVFIRLMNGSRNESIWWDLLTVDEIPSLATPALPPFCGDSKGCSWGARPNYSWSYYNGPDWVDWPRLESAA